MLHESEEVSKAYKRTHEHEHCRHIQSDSGALEAGLVTGDDHHPHSCYQQDRLQTEVTR